MRTSIAPEPIALEAVKERVAAIKARFRIYCFGSSTGEAASRLAPRPGAETLPYSPLADGQALRLHSARAGLAGVGESIVRVAERYHLNEALLAAVAQAESAFNPRAVSADGAMGIMQLMPGTARRLGVLDPFDLEANLDAGARYLREQLDQFGGDVALALAAYNAGPGAVLRYGGMPPYPETRRFVARVLEAAFGGRASQVRPQE